MKLTTPAGSRTVLWRTVNLMLIACMLFGLGALGSAAGGNGRTGAPSDEATAPAPSDDAANEGAPDDSFTRTEAPSVAEDGSGVSRLAEETSAAGDEEETSEILPVAPRPSISRESTTGPLTIGDTWKVDITVTVPANTTLDWPKIRDDLNRHGAYYVDGSTTLTDISGTPVSGAQLRPGMPAVREDTDGAIFAWRMDNPIEAGATDYVFKLSYMYQYTGVKPSNAAKEMWLATDGQGIRGEARIAWWSEDIGGPAPPARDTNTSELSNERRTHVDQPLLDLTKTDITSLAIPHYNGWYVIFLQHIRNVGYSTANDITWKDQLPSQLTEPALLAVYNPGMGPAAAAIPINDITTEVDSEFNSSPVTIDFGDKTLVPGEAFLVQYVCWVDMFSVPGGLSGVLNGGLSVTNTADVNWSSMPGDITGERVYDDQPWEENEWTDDTASETVLIDSSLPSLTLTKELADETPSTVFLGDEVTYDITVTNSSATTATTVPISDLWDPQELEYVSATLEPDVDGPIALDWFDASGGAGLAPGETLAWQATFKTIAAGNDVKNRAFIEWGAYSPPSGGGSLPSGGKTLEMVDLLGPSMMFEGNLAVAEIDIVDLAAISFVKSADPVEGTIMLPGETITYTLTGATDIDGLNVFTTDVLDDSVEYLPGTIRVVDDSGTVLPITDDILDGDGGGYWAPDRMIVGPPYYNLGETVGAKMLFDVVVRDAEFSKQGVQNAAKLYLLPEEDISSNTGIADVPDPTAATLLMDSNTVYHPVDPFAIEKVGEDVNGGQLLPGDDILWTITVTNTGITPTTNVVVYDTVPEHTTYKADSITGLGADDSGNPDLLWNVGQMPVDGVEVCTFISTVDYGTPNGTQITNQAAVESDQSFLAFSDSPTTSETGDATLLQTGQNDWLWLTLAMLAAGLGTAFTIGGRKWLKNDA